MEGRADRKAFRGRVTLLIMKKKKKTFFFHAMYKGTQAQTIFFTILSIRSFQPSLFKHANGIFCFIAFSFVIPQYITTFLGKSFPFTCVFSLLYTFSFDIRAIFSIIFLNAFFFFLFDATSMHALATRSISKSRPIEAHQ